MRKAMMMMKAIAVQSINQSIEEEVVGKRRIRMTGKMAKERKPWCRGLGSMVGQVGRVGTRQMTKECRMIYGFCAEAETRKRLETWEWEPCTHRS